MPPLRHLPACPIPLGAQINPRNNRVFVILNDGGKLKRKVVGEAVDADTMLPVKFFQDIYPSLWKDRYVDPQVRDSERLFGLYAFFLARATASGLYPILTETVGAAAANAIMDLALPEDDPCCGPALMRFSGECRDADWYGSFFARGLDAGQLLQLKMQWTRACAEKGHTSVWLAATALQDQDGPVTCIRALSENDGTPVSWALSRMHCNAACLQEMQAFLAPFGISVAGVLLDAACCSREVTDHLQETGMPWLAELNDDHPLFQSMVERHGASLRWNCRHLLCGCGLFGMSAGVQELGFDGMRGSVGLFFDAMTAASDSVDFLHDMRHVEQDISRAFAGDEDVRVPEAYAAYFSLEKDGDAESLMRLHPAWQEKMDRLGMSCILSSQGLDAEAMHRLLDLFKPDDAPVDAPGAEGQSATALETWLAACVAVDVLDHKARAFSSAIGMDTGAIEEALEDCRLIRSQGRWWYLNGTLQLDDPLFAGLELTRRSISAIAGLANEQQAAIDEGRPCDAVIHALPLRRGAAPRTGTGRRGRPVGVRQQKVEATRELFQLVQEGGQVTVEMLLAAGLKLPGLNGTDAPAQPTPAASAAPATAVSDNGAPAAPAAAVSDNGAPAAPAAAAADSVAPEAPVRHGRGRPKGSRNRKTLEREALLITAAAAPAAPSAGTPADPADEPPAV